MRTKTNNADLTAQAVMQSTLMQAIASSHLLKIDPTVPTITEWSEANRYLPAGTTERPGLWQAAFVPYTVEIQECLHPDSPVRVVSIMKSTQSVMTTTIENAIGHAIKYGLHNILYVISDLDMAKLRSMGAIDVLIDFCGLSELIKPITKRENQRKSSDTILYKEFSGGRRLLMTSYKSITKLKSFSWDFIVMDELVEAPFELADQGDPEAIIEARGKTIRDLKVVKISTPIAGGLCRISKAFKSGDQREYMIPCPRCGGFQFLEFMRNGKTCGLYGDYDFDKRGKASLVPDTERYKCKLCEKDFYEYEKEEFMKCREIGGQAYWEAQAVAQDHRDRSYHISAMMSPMTEWANIITDYLKTDMGKKLQEFKNFVITNEGLPFVNDRRIVIWEELKQRAENYKKGEVPEGGYFLTGGADIHKNRIELVLTAWGPGLEAWIFDHEVFYGQTADINSRAWQGLLQYVNRDRFVPALPGVPVSVAMVAIDSSYNPNKDATLDNDELRSEVNATLQFCARYPDYFTAVKGIEEGKSTGFTLTQKRHRTIACDFYLCDVGAIKDEIFNPETLIESTGGRNAVHFSFDFPDDFFRQFASEYYGENDKGKIGWHKLTERNEVLDCFVYSRAAAMICGWHLWSEDDWLDMRDRIMAD